METGLDPCLPGGADIVRIMERGGGGVRVEAESLVQVRENSSLTSGIALEGERNGQIWSIS